ncbi:MAG: tetratricopeptide repeat protein, partial [Gemmatimonadota bacterium]|nr:tetratricopeptide repeat protein [Gemmatimonadota bacterium]
MSRKRLSKKQLKRDRFVEQTFDWAHWVETHRREVLGGVVAAVLLVAGFFVWRSMQASATEAAARDYLSARQAYDTGNWALAASDLQTFVDRHGGTPYGDDAMFFLASAYYQSGQMEPAIQT